MKGIGQSMTVGERVAWYRRRRGMSQEVLAGLVGRTVDWLSKAENNRIDLDRLSVVRTLADALDVTLGDLLSEPTMLEWSRESGTRTIPALRESLLDYRRLTPFALAPTVETWPTVAELSVDVAQLWDAYQASKYGLVTARLPFVATAAHTTANHAVGAEREKAYGLLGLTYQIAAVVLTKLGEADLAWIAAERGLAAAQRSDDPTIIGSVFRAVVHALLSTGRFREARKLTEDGAAYLQGGLAKATDDYLSVYGGLLLAGSIAAGRDQDRGTVRAFLQEAETTAQRLGRDGNHLWTAFGPTNVAIHRVATAMDLGDVQVAIDLGARLDASAMPIERRVRHAIENARALTAWNRSDEALAALLEAEQIGPEQVRHHAICRQLVQKWVQRGRRKPSYQLAGLAQRVHAV
jgi:transcriptional regulator with XRE-family HTH domain